MKYWKLFWNNLNLGWKRVHYVFIPLLYFIINLFIYNGQDPDEMVVTIFIQIPLIIIIYMFVTSIIMWIKEGFN